MEGLVIARSGQYIGVWVPEKGRVFWGIPRGKLLKAGERVYAGDRVAIRQVAPEEVAIEAILERKNLLPQPPIANVDKIVVVTAWHEPEFSHLILDGILAEVEFFEVEAVIVFNKMDLVRKREKPKLKRWRRLYEGIGYPVLYTSVVTGEGLETLKEAIRGNLVVLAGQSGVGKSSLLNALIPEAQRKTEEVSERTGRGRHVTTEVCLLPNPHGGWVADTPGFARVDLPEWVSLESLPWLYREFTRYRCEFHDCTHTSEPGCQVKEAVRKGEIAKERYQTYLYWLTATREAGGE